MLHTAKNILVNSVKQFSALRCQYRATSLAYVTVLAMVPMFSILVAFLTTLSVSQEIILQLQNFVFDNFIPESGDKIQQYIQVFISQAQKLPWIDFIFLLIIAFYMLNMVATNVNRLWHVRDKRRFGKRVFIYFCILVLAPVLFALSISVSSYFFSLAHFPSWSLLGYIGHALLSCLPFLCGVLGFGLMYWLVPNCKVHARSALVGAVVATLLFELDKKLFSLYVSYFPAYDLIYGALAVVPMFLIWVYLFWLVVLFGAVVAYQCEEVLAANSRW